jgi:hypothetical protein
MFAGAGDRHGRRYLGLKIDDVTTAQSGVADVALTLTYGNPSSKTLSTVWRVTC